MNFDVNTIRQRLGMPPLNSTANKDTIGDITKKYDAIKEKYNEKEDKAIIEIINKKYRTTAKMEGVVIDDGNLMFDPKSKVFVKVKQETSVPTAKAPSVELF